MKSDVVRIAVIAIVAVFVAKLAAPSLAKVPVVGDLAARLG